MRRGLPYDLVFAEHEAALKTAQPYGLISEEPEKDRYNGK